MRRIGDRWWLVGLTLLAGVVVLSAAVFAVESARRSVQRQATQRAAVVALRDSVHDVLAREVGLARVLGVLGGPVRDRWPVLASTVTSQPLAYSAGFIAPVSERDHVAFEARTGLKLFQSATPGALRSVTRRPEYFVLTADVRKSPAPPMLGLDLGANPVRRAALVKAAVTGRQVATPPVQFLAGGDRRGVVVYEAVRDARGRLKGWVTASYEAGQLASSITARTPGLQLTVRDGGQSLVSGRGAPAGTPGAINVAGRRWSVWASLPGAGVGAVPWLVLGLGLSLTLAVVLVLRQAVSRERYATAQVERHVASERERQAELDAERNALADAQAIAQVGSWSWEPVSERTEWSSEMYRIFERDPAEGPAANEDFFAYLRPEDRDRIALGYAEALGAGAEFEFDFDFRIVTGNGEVRSLHAIGYPKPDGRYVGTVQDISALRRVEDALIEAERANRTLAMLVAQSENAVIAKTLPEGLITDWNRGAERIYGYAAGEIVGQPISVLVPAERKGEERGIMDQLLADRAIPNYETTRRRKDGSVIDVSITLSPIHDDDGLITGASAISHDITERKRGERELQRAKAALAEAQRVAHIGSWAWDLATDLVSCSEELGRIYGLESGELVTSFEGFIEQVHSADRERVQSSLKRSLETGRPFRFDHRIVGPEGSVRIIEANGYPILDDQRTPERMMGTGQDVTELRGADRAMREAEERFRGAFEEAPIGMALLELDGRFMQVNDSLCRILGYPREQMEEMRVESITHPDDLEATERALAEIRAATRTSYSAESRYLPASGDPLTCALQATVILGGDGRPSSVLAQVQDITDRKRNEEQLEYLADHDALTGLLNRRAFARELASHAELAERYGRQGTVLMIDLDQFKFVNDTLGHRAGDELIVRVGQLLAERLRTTDVLARLGGDEFAALLPRADLVTGRLVAQSLLETLRDQAISVVGTERKITASIGIASFAGGSELSGEDVLINADLALYDAKEDGRDRLAIFGTEHPSPARMMGRITWAQKITSALENDNFTLLAQPIIELATQRVSQYELLLRMNDDHGDLIPPSAFLYIAERLDLIQDIDAWVVTNGVRALAEVAPGDPDIALEINLSGRSLGDQKLLEHIDSELRNARISPSRIIFEVTETAALTSVTRARAFGEHLSEIGCRFALDDFGAGFGSFYYLKHLVFDYLKIDGEFIRDCCSNDTDPLVIKAIVDIARGMGKRTIAEFVGDDETVSLLRHLGVDYGQGYHIGVPADLREQLAARARPSAPLLS
jgi:diguanylate cyclase (GGDEF)-like protein/PAS domain S-box-containing protein